MERLAHIRKTYSKRTQIDAAAYNQAKEALTEEQFALAYLKEQEDGQAPVYYKLDYDPEDARFILLEEIRKNTYDTMRYTSYIWYFIELITVLTVLGFLVSIFANM